MVEKLVSWDSRYSMIRQALWPLCGALFRLTVGTTNRYASFIHSDKRMECDAVLGVLQ